MYTLYTDKGENFKCNIEVQGAKLSQTKARLVIESKGHSILFEGKVDGNGECIVPIVKLKDILEEGEQGEMRLEVIAEDTFFSPWKSEYKVKTNKKVTVEVKESENNTLTETKVKKVTVKEVSQKPTIVENIHTVISERKLPRKVLNENNLRLIVKSYIKKYNLNDNPELVLRGLKKIINA